MALASGIGGSSGTSGSETSRGGSAASVDADAPFDCPGAAAGETVPVPAGAFTMGCATGDTTCDDVEKPPHTVSLSAFEIDRTEVTQEQYAGCVQAGACERPSCNWDCTKTSYPAGCIEWAQAKVYCAWAGKRLPTEAQWEKAARGTDGRKYPWGDDAPDCSRVNMAGCGEHADAVGARPTGASPYGALDMAGNAVEMVGDWYDAQFYTSPQAAASDTQGPATGTRYVGRGGGYKSEAVWQRASARDWYDLTDESEPLGFRCVR